MVLALSGGSKYIYVTYVLEVFHHPAEGLGLVVVFLLVDLDDDVAIFLSVGCRDRVQISNDPVRKALPAEDRSAGAQELLQRPVAADDEICSADQVARVLCLWEGTVAYYYDIVIHLLLLPVMMCPGLCRRSEARGIR